MRTVAACAALAFVLASCSGGAGTMDGIMRSWQGAPLDAAIAQWGYPDQEQVIAGHKLYRWYYTKTATLPATTTGTVNQINTAYMNATTYGGGTVVGNCTRTLEVDEHNIVVRTNGRETIARLLRRSNTQAGGAN